MDDDDSDQGPPIRVVDVTNQFGDETLTVRGPRTLCVPSLKNNEKPSTADINLDHFKCYDVEDDDVDDSADDNADTDGSSDRFVTLVDQFGFEIVRVLGATLFCVGIVRSGLRSWRGGPALDPSLLSDAIYITRE